MNQTPAQSRIARLSGLDFFPVADEAILELANALQRLGNEERQDEFVSDWLSESRKAPKPADVRLWAYANLSPSELRPWIVADCQKCQGTGWEEVTVRHGKGVKRCGCRGGAG